MTAIDPVLADFVAAACDQLADLADAIDNGALIDGHRIPLDLSAIDRLRVPLGRLAVRCNELSFRLADPGPAFAASLSELAGPGHNDDDL